MFLALGVLDRFPAVNVASLPLSWVLLGDSRWLGSQAKRPLIVHVHFREPMAVGWSLLFYWALPWVLPSRFQCWLLT